MDYKSSFSEIARLTDRSHQVSNPRCADRAGLTGRNVNDKSGQVLSNTEGAQESLPLTVTQRVTLNPHFGPLGALLPQQAARRRCCC